MIPYLKAVMEGRRRGFAAAVARGFLSAASLLYALGHLLHRLAYATGIRRSVKLPVPVISIGNLTTGGTGKTPLVELLVRRLVARRLRVAVLARGYGRTSAGDDEDLLAGIAGAARFAGADRVASARRALEEFKPDVFVLDDGFQHYRIRRDADLVTVDATGPFHNGRLLPAGLLRDRPSALRRADLVVLTRTDQVTPADLAQVRERVALHSGGLPTMETVHRPSGVRLPRENRTVGLDWLRGRSVFAFCGLGNPESFWRTARGAGADVVKTRAFPDHHPYGAKDLRQLEAEAQEFMADLMLTSEKDATKLDPASFSRPLAALRVELEAVRGDDALESLLDRVVRSRAATEVAPAR